MRERRGCSAFSVILVIGLLAALGILAFMVSTSLRARAEQTFGPPADSLNPIQNWQLSLSLAWRAEALLRPVNESGDVQVFNIELDEATDSILNRLQSEGLIREAEFFGDYLVYSGLDRQLQAGEFELSPAMTAVEIAQTLLSPNPGKATLTIFAGWRLEEIILSLPLTGLEFSTEDFWDAAHSSYAEFDFLLELAEGSSLEGYFPPGSYVFEREAGAEDVARHLLEVMELQLSENLLQGFSAQGLNLHQALTLASIVERESVIKEEMPLIASVFLNRLEAGMRLEADPTVQYALGFDLDTNNWWTSPLNSEDLAIESAYNSYLYAGLPPGPIASPSLSALEAVAYPENSSFFFFQAACDGSGKHVFALSYEEHLVNNCP